MLQSGDILVGKYRLLEPLGEGGGGQVFAAVHLHTGRELAIKVLHELLLDDLSARMRFLQEARTAVRLRHPHVVEVFDLDMDDSGTRPFIVQERLHGETLDRTLAARPGGRLDAAEALRVLVPVMGALVGAHRRGVVHRDLKPSNVFLSQTPDGVVPKLIDFGVAKVHADRNATLLTATGTLIGTPAYMSPEQVSGDRALDARTDVWSMGVVLYETLAGRLPFEAPSAAEAMVRILYHDPTPLLAVRSDLPPDLAAVVHRALERSLDRRYPSMQALIEAVLDSSCWNAIGDDPPEFDTFDRALESDTADDAAVTTPQLAAPVQAPVPIQPAPTTPTAPTRPIRGWVVAAALALVALAALLGRAAAQAGW